MKRGKRKRKTAPFGCSVDGGGHGGGVPSTCESRGQGGRGTPGERAGGGERMKGWGKGATQPRVRLAAINGRRAIGCNSGEDIASGGETLKKIKEKGLQILMGVAGSAGAGGAPFAWPGALMYTHQRGDEGGQREEHQDEGQHLDDGVSDGVPGVVGTRPRLQRGERVRGQSRLLSIVAAVVSVEGGALCR